MKTDAEKHREFYNRKVTKWTPAQRTEPYSSVAFLTKRYANVFAPFVPDKARVFEIGSGTGASSLAFINVFRDKVVSFHGIDVSEGMLKYARERIKDSRVTFTHVPAGRIENIIASRSIDFAFAQSVYTHLKIENVVYYFEQLQRILVPGAYFYISAMNLLDIFKPDINNIANPWCKLIGCSYQQWLKNEPMDNEGGFFAFYTTDMMKLLGSYFGFNLVVASKSAELCFKKYSEEVLDV